MRIAAINCSDAELAALRSAVGGEVFAAEGLVEVPAFDFAIFGSAEIRDGNLPDVARERARVPAAVIIPAREMYASIDPDLGAFTLGELDRVAHVIRQQVEFGKRFDERSATHRRLNDREAEDALRESESRYRTLVEQASDIIFGLDGEGRFTSLNRAFETITGWSRVEWIGRPFSEILDPASAETASRRFGEVVAGAPPTPTEYSLRTRRGEVLAIETTSQVVHGADGRVGTIGITRDITRRKEAVAELERARRLSSLGKLATSVAHEFNNVLMSILPFAELLQRKYSSDDRAANSIKHIIGAVHRGREISQEILRYARPPRAEIAPVALGTWLPRAASRIESALGGRHPVRVSMTGENFVGADARLLEQVLASLARNAAEAMPDGGEIVLEARGHADGTVSIDVIDTGTGIDESLHERIFEPLYSTKRGGNGLGLSLAYQAMGQQQGTLKVRSTPGLGSTFTITLPSVSAPSVNPISVATAARRILLIEDEEAVGEGLRILLGEEGFEVRLVATGNAALPAIEEFAPDVVVLDVNLPDVSGVEVFERIRAARPTLQVIFSTGHADATALAQMQGVRVPSIMKPYDVRDLVELIASVVPGSTPA